MGTLLTTVSTAVILAAVTAAGLYVIRLIDGGRLASEVEELVAAMRDLRREQATQEKENAALRARVAALEAELHRHGVRETRITEPGDPN